jgi:hypothetical protein
MTLKMQVIFKIKVRGSNLKNRNSNHTSNYHLMINELKSKKFMMSINKLRLLMSNNSFN